jgi:hypothetical protein
LVEHQLWELAVAGSNPVAPTIFIFTPLLEFIHKVVPIFSSPEAGENFLHCANRNTFFRDDLFGGI